MTTTQTQPVDQNSEVVLSAHRVALPTTPPERFLLTPWGRVESAKGDYMVDAQAAESIVANFERKGVDLVIDLDHQSVMSYPSAPDGSRRAVGWVKALDVVPGEGIYASNTEWTENGASLISSREYRYISPAILQKKRTGEVVAFHSASLTNKPAITGMVPVANRDSPDIGGDSMDSYDKLLATLREKLKLKDDADEPGVITALSEAIETVDASATLREKVCKSLGVEVSAHDDRIIEAVGELKKPGEEKEGSTPTEPDPSMYVTMSAHTEAVEQLKAAQQQIREIQCVTFMDKGRSEGRIAPNSEERWKEKFLADPGQAEKDLELVPKNTFPAPGRMTAHSDSRSTGTGGGAGGRKTLIAQARDEFKDNRQTLPCTEKEYVNQFLSEHNEAALSDEEVTAHSVVA